MHRTGVPHCTVPCCTEWLPPFITTKANHSFLDQLSTAAASSLWSNGRDTSSAAP